MQNRREARAETTTESGLKTHYETVSIVAYFGNYSGQLAKLGKVPGAEPAMSGLICGLHGAHEALQGSKATAMPAWLRRKTAKARFSAHAAAQVPVHYERAWHKT